MSSVDGVSNRTGSGENDVSRKHREDSDANQVEENKRHQKELAKLHKDYTAQIKSLQESHTNAMDDMRDRSKSSMSARDQQFQKEIDDIRNMHRNQFKKTVEDYEGRIKLTRDTAANEVDQQKKRSAEIENSIRGNYEGQVKSQQKMLEAQTIDSREKMNSELVEQRERLGKANEIREGELRKGREEDVVNLQRTNERIRETKDDRIRDLETKMELQGASREAKYKGDVKRIKDQHDKAIKEARMWFKEGLDDTRNKFHKAEENRSHQTAIGFDNLKRTVSGRLDGQISSLENQLADSRLEKDLNLLEQKRISDLEKRKVIQENGRALELSEAIRQASLKDSNEQNAAQMAEVVKKTDGMMHNREAYYSDRLEKQETLSHANMEQQKGIHASQIDSQANQAKLQLSKAKNQFSLDRKNLEESFRESLEVLKRSHHEKMSLVRNKLMAEKQQSLVELQTAMRESEAKQNSKLAETIERYENTMADMKNNYQRDMLKERARGETILKEARKESNMRQESMAMQYEARIAAQTDQHSEQLDQLRKQFDNARQELMKSPNNKS